jgi:hypothetical protein
MPLASLIRLQLQQLNFSLLVERHMSLLLKLRREGLQTFVESTVATLVLSEQVVLLPRGAPSLFELLPQAAWLTAAHLGRKASALLLALCELFLQGALPLAPAAPAPGGGP